MKPKVLTLAVGIATLLHASGQAAVQLGGPSTIVQGLPDQYFVFLLIVSGLLLMLAEIKVTSYGLLGLGGLACVIGACAILIRTNQYLFGVPPKMIIPVLGALTVIEMILVVLSVKSTKGGPSTGVDSFVGQIAEVAKAIAPEGKVFFHGTYWDAVSTAPIAAGQKVRIVAADNVRLTVAPVE